MLTDILLQRPRVTRASSAEVLAFDRRPKSSIPRCRLHSPALSILLCCGQVEALQEESRSAKAVVEEACVEGIGWPQARVGVARSSGSTRKRWLNWIVELSFAYLPRAGWWGVDALPGVVAWKVARRVALGS